MTKPLTPAQRLTNAQTRATGRRQATEAALAASGQTLASAWGTPAAKAVVKASRDEMAAYLAAFDARQAG